MLIVLRPRAISCCETSRVIFEQKHSIEGIADLTVFGVGIDQSAGNDVCSVLTSDEDDKHPDSNVSNSLFNEWTR